MVSNEGSRPRVPHASIYPWLYRNKSFEQKGHLVACFRGLLEDHQRSREGEKSTNVVGVVRENGSKLLVKKEEGKSHRECAHTEDNQFNTPGWPAQRWLCSWIRSGHTRHQRRDEASVERTESRLNE